MKTGIWKYLLWGGLAVFAISTTIYTWNWVAQKKNQVVILMQENKALKDSSYAVIADLGNKVSKLQKTLEELEITIIPKPDSAHIELPPVILPEEERPDSVWVNFKGSNYLFDYTVNNRLSTTTFGGYTDLSFEPKEIKLKATIFQDADGSYYQKVESENQAIGISTKFKIDKIALGLKPVIPKPEPKFRVYGIFGLEDNWDRIRPEGGVRVKLFNFDLDVTSARIGLTYQLKLF